MERMGFSEARGLVSAVTGSRRNYTRRKIVPAYAVSSIPRLQSAYERLYEQRGSPWWMGPFIVLTDCQETIMCLHFKEVGAGAYENLMDFLMLAVRATGHIRIDTARLIELRAWLHRSKEDNIGNILRAGVLSGDALHKHIKQTQYPHFLDDALRKVAARTEKSSGSAC